MEFVIVEDNGGAYHWTVLGSSGESLGQSSRFASYQEAEDAAHFVRGGAGSARLERRAAVIPIVEVARPDTPVVSHDSDGERWLDEGGRHSSKAATN
jgi:uncharacterized protein YegP (UPF0339 family)